MKTLGVALMLAAVACSVVAFQQSRETDLGRLMERSLALAESELRSFKAVEKLQETIAQIEGGLAPLRDTTREEDLRESRSKLSADLDRYRSQRSQTMLLWSGGAAVSFLSSIICLAASWRPLTSKAENQLLAKLSKPRWHSFKNER